MNVRPHSGEERGLAPRAERLPLDIATIPRGRRRARAVSALARASDTRAERVFDAIVALGHLAGPDRVLGDYLDRVASVVCDALDYRTCIVYLHDRFDDAYYAEAAQGLADQERQQLLATSVPTRVAERLMCEPFRLDRGYYVPSSAAVWDDREVSACFTAPARTLPAWSSGWQPGDILLMPLDLDGTVPIGFLLVDDPLDGRLPSRETRRGLAALATSCANAVESARLYQMQNEEAAISSVLLQVSKAVGTPDQELLFSRTSAILAALLGADHCAVWHTEDGSAALRPVAFAPAQGSPTQSNGAAQDTSPIANYDELWGAEDELQAMLARGEPVVVEQVTSGGASGLVERLGLTSALLIPLFLHDALVGAITVGWSGPTHRFRVRELDIARGVSRLVGVALQNARLYRDVTRQAERNAELYEREREAVRRLQELDQLRNDFVSTVSHELRTPLTGIKGFTETLLNYWERMDEERRVAMVRKVRTSSNRLERLVQDLLFISRIEAGGLPLHSVPTSPQPLIDGAAQEIEAKYRGQVVQVRPPAGSALVLADPDRLQQIIVNLLDNAAKYSPEGRPVRIRWHADARHVYIRVADRGPGIPPADFARLFTRFGKLDHAPRSGHGGTGLGLYISKSLVEAMGGRIVVRSRPGWGSVFTVSLPLAHAP